MNAVLVAGGETAAGDADHLNEADLVVAADGGAEWLSRIGRRPDALVGDLDSVRAALVEQLESDGVVVERHPVEKDASDTELALRRVLAAGVRQVTILGALGGARLDHELAGLLLLADPAWSRDLVDLRIVRGATTVRALHGGQQLQLEGRPGELVSLLPIAEARGVTTAGLRYPLQGERLLPGSTRGVSNRIVEAGAMVRLDHGVLLVIETAGEEATR